MLQSDLCDYIDACIVVKGTIIITREYNGAFDKKLALKTNAPFIICITKIYNSFFGNAED